MNEQSLKSPQPFAVLTATCDAYGAADSQMNRNANQRLRDYLNWAGFAFEEARGYYNGVDQGVSFFVFGMGRHDAVAVGFIFNQESVITNEGLVFCADNRLVPSCGILTGETAETSGNYTEHPANGFCWSFVLGSEPVDGGFVIATC